MQKNRAKPLRGQQPAPNGHANGHINGHSNGVPKTSFVDPRLVVVPRAEDAEYLRSLGFDAVRFDDLRGVSLRRVVVWWNSNDAWADPLARKILARAADESVFGALEAKSLQDVDADGTTIRFRGEILEWTADDVIGQLDAAEGYEDLPEPIANEVIHDPFRLARGFLARQTRHDGLALRHYRDEWVHWDGFAWRTKTLSDIKKAVAGYIKGEFDAHNQALSDKQSPLLVSRDVVANVIMAMASLSGVDSSVVQPSWFGRAPFPADEAVPTKSGIVRIPAEPDGAIQVMPRTPRFFCPYSVEYGYDPIAPEPRAWLDFLAWIWPDDPQSIETLQEWFGYLLKRDNSHQKLLYMVGPIRSGKGTIARAATNLIGRKNVANPTLSSLAGQFGLAPLVGKPLAIIGDARFGGGIPEQKVVVERLLTISGGDDVTIDRKHKDALLDHSLPTRFMILSNEIPRLRDDGGAITSRFLMLRFTRSAFGKENRALRNQIDREMPGILKWAIEGWRRLQINDRFSQPESGEEFLEMAADASSPIAAFVRDRIDWTGDERDYETVQAVFDAYEEWCRKVRCQPARLHSFAPSLYSALPELKKSRQKRDGSGARPWTYFGLRLKVAF